MLVAILPPMVPSPMNPTTISLAIVTPLSLRGVLVVTVETKPWLKQDL
jgi:hypothetical protein